MTKTVFNKSSIDFTKQPMFFGEDQNTQRFDTFKYPIFDKLTQQQLGYFWRPEEVSLQNKVQVFVPSTEVIPEKFVKAATVEEFTRPASVEYQHLSKATPSLAV